MRAKGLYWVKLEGEWTLANWHGFYWLRSERVYSSDELEEIGPLIMPQGQGIDRGGDA